MIQLRNVFLIALITISFNGTSQNSIDSITISKSIRLIQDFKSCREEVDTLRFRIGIYEMKVNADAKTISSCNDVVKAQDDVIKIQSDKIHKLEQQKNNRKWWAVGGAIIGVSVTYFFLTLF